MEMSGRGMRLDDYLPFTVFQIVSLSSRGHGQLSSGHWKKRATIFEEEQPSLPCAYNVTFWIPCPFSALTKVSFNTSEEQKNIRGNLWVKRAIARSIYPLFDFKRSHLNVNQGWALWSRSPFAFELPIGSLFRYTKIFKLSPKAYNPFRGDSWYFVAFSHSYLMVVKEADCLRSGPKLREVEGELYHSFATDLPKLALLYWEDQPDKYQSLCPLFPSQSAQHLPLQ